MDSHFDYILTGGGAAGLSLALALLDSELSNKRVLIVDPEEKTRNDRTWCYWDSKDQIDAMLIHRTWRRLHFIGESWSRQLELGNYKYAMIRGVDYYRYAYQRLKKSGQILFLKDTVSEVTQREGRVLVTCEGGTYSGDYCFDSRFRFSDYTDSKDGRSHHLIQHFRGWEIETPQIAFNPASMTLFDFRTPQKGSMRFVYVLPLSEKRALIEYTLFSEHLLPSDDYDAALKTYIESVLKIRNYHVLSVEDGKIPMSDRPAQLANSSRHIYIGTRAGRVKPSSGYAFLRIQQDSRAIVRSLVETGDPMKYRPRTRRWYAWFDRVMLHVMKHHGGQMAAIFTQLFKNNPAGRIFRFLDEEAGIIEILQVLTSITPWPFLQALIQTIILKKV